MSSHSTPIRL